jgi:hypothetical protein
MGLKNLSFVGDTKGFRTAKKAVLYSNPHFWGNLFIHNIWTYCKGAVMLMIKNHLLGFIEWSM